MYSNIRYQHPLLQPRHSTLQAFSLSETVFTIQALLAQCSILMPSYKIAQRKSHCTPNQKKQIGYNTTHHHIHHKRVHPAYARCTVSLSRKLFCHMCFVNIWIHFIISCSMTVYFNHITSRLYIHKEITCTCN